MPIKYTGGAAKEIYDKINQEILDENIMNAIHLANKECNKDIEMSVNNIIQAVKILNREDL